MQRSTGFCFLLIFWLTSLQTTLTLSGAEPFRPKAGEFPPIEKAHSYRGELTFVDHANRRGSLRVEGSGVFRKNDPHPFAMLPYGIVRYHNATADLRDIPLGTVMHVKAFLPPDPKISAVPVLPVDNKNRDANHNRGKGIFPAENHVLLLEDEPSYCLRNGLAWQLKQLTIANSQGTIVAQRTTPNGLMTSDEETLTFNGATRIWRGRELLHVTDIVEEGLWPAAGDKSLEDFKVLLGITWKPTTGNIFTQFHISDIWLDDTSIHRASRIQNETHKSHIRSRWMPAQVDTVEYGKFGRATVTATLFGGMAPTLYQDFKKGNAAMMASSENTLKHWAGGSAGTSQMACRGTIQKVSKQDAPPTLGSSGIQITFETDLITEGLRPSRVIRIHPSHWPDVQVPREEYLLDRKATDKQRFPTPDIFPSY